MSKNGYVVIALQSFQASHRWDFGQKVLQVLYDADPRLHPDRIGTDDTELRKKLPCKSVADWEPMWAYEAEEDVDLPQGVISTLFWKRYRPLQVFGSFNFLSRTRNGTLLPSALKLKCKFVEDIDYLSMFEAWCSLYKPSQGYLHYIGPYDRWRGGEVVLTEEDERRIGAGLPDINPRSIEMDKWDHFSSGSFGARREPQTFNLGQVNFFPHSIITSSVAASLESAGFNIVQRDYGCFVYLCSSLSDVKDNFAEFSRRRAIAKAIIGQHIFAIKDEPEIN